MEWQGIFRKAVAADEGAIADLYSLVRREGREAGTCDWSDDYPNSTILKQDLAEEMVFVLEKSGEIVGAVSLLRTDDLDQEPLGWKALKSCVPARLCVSPRHQGKGLGKLVMAELETCAAALSYESMRLLASTTNLAANALYQKIGFSDLGKVSLYGNEYHAYEKVFS